MARFMGAAACAAACLIAGGVRADELFVGGYAHDVWTVISQKDRERGQDVEVGYRTGQIEALAGIGRPMLFAQFSGNDARRTSFGAIGVVWRRAFNSRLYGQIGVGAALHDHYNEYADPHQPGISAAEASRRFYIERNYKALGTRALFEPQLAFGYRLSKDFALEASWVHISNAGLSHVNPGLDDFGGRLVWRFGPKTR